MDPFVFVIIIVSIVFGSIVSIAKSDKKSKNKRGADLSQDETRIMQEIHQSLGKMEKRIEALETIIINRK